MRAKRQQVVPRGREGGQDSVYLGFVVNLNFLQKALSSSGTDRVNVIAPSESDRTTRAGNTYMA